MDARGIRFLKRKDKTLARIIADVGPCTLRPRKRYFVALCEAIIAQQVSLKAGETVFGRFKDLFDRKLPTPTAVLQKTDAELRSVGISRQKNGYLRALAMSFDDGTIPRHGLSKLDDDAIIERLTRVKGIGLWTAQMFLMFVLARPDVLPVGDLGFQRAVRLHYLFNEMPTEAELIALGETWRPYRSLAVWYLWQSLKG